MSDFVDSAGSAPAAVPEAQETFAGHTGAELSKIADALGAGAAGDPDISAAAHELNEMLGRGMTGEDADFGGPDGVQRGAARDAAGRFVPHQAMHAERERRKAAETRAQELEVKTAKAEERLAVINQLLEAQTGAHHDNQEYQLDPNAEIDPEVDIFGAVKQLKQQNAQIKKQNEQKQLVDSYRHDAMNFMRKHPDLTQAYQHLEAARDRELQVLGFTDAAQRKQQIMLEEAQLVKTTLAQGRSAAETIYQMAQTRGYQPRQTGSFTQLADPAAMAQIQRIQQGREANASMSGHGGSPGQGLTIDQIVNMPDDQFGNLVNKLGGLKSPAIKRAFGGG